MTLEVRRNNVWILMCVWLADISHVTRTGGGHSSSVVNIYGLVGAFWG